MSLRLPRRQGESDWALVSLASIVLLLGAFYAYAASFLIPDSGLAYSSTWTIQNIDSCGRREAWCAANPGDLLPGDQMLRIGGVSHADYVSDRWLVAFDGYSPGDLVPIEYKRDGELRSTEWLMPMTPLRDRLRHLTSAWPFVPFWMAGTAVLLFLRPRDERWRLLIAFNYVTALWYLVGLVSTFHVAAAAFVVRIASWLFVPISLHLHLTVPSPLFSPKRTRSILRPLYALSAVLAVVEMLWILPAIIFYLGMLSAIAGSIGLLIYRQFDRSSAASRLATRQMLMGIVLAFGPGLALWVVPSILGVQVNSPLAVQVSALALPLLPLFYTYAIYKRHLGDSEFRASRLLGTYSFLLIYLTAVALIYLVGSRWIDTSTQSLVFGVVISTIFVVAAPTLRARYQSFVDRVVYGAVYNPDEIIQAFATRIPMAATHQAIAELIVDEVLPSLLIRQSALLIRSDSAWEPVYARGISLESAGAGRAGYHALLAEAGHYREPAEPTDQKHQALVALRGPDPFEWVRLALPLGSPEKPMGIWLFGQRDPDDFYAQSEIRVLRALAGQVTVALENAQLYRFLQQQADEITMLYRASAGLINPGSDLSAVAERIVRTVMREFASATPLVDCSLLLVDESHQALRRVVTASAFPVAGTVVPLNGAGLVVSAFQGAEVVYVPDVSRDKRYVANEPRTRSELAIPLRSGERVIGVLDLQSSEQDAFDERARRIVTAFAERAALALENTLLLGHLDQARRVAEEANQLKSEFLANTSHELRTPLTGILGSLNVVLDDLCESPEEERDFLQVAYTSAQHLLTIVNDILDIARIEAGKMEIIPYALDVTHVLNEVYALTRVQAEEKNLSLEIRPPQAPGGPVYADHDRLRQILLNLVGNAIKFTHTGKIVVQACIDPDLGEMAIEVVDTGIGIAPDKQGKLFQPFVQVDGSQTRQYGGTGLGLSISRRLAEQMHGTLTLFSAGEGQGSRFTLRLPLAGTPLERHPPDGFGPVER